MTPHLPSRRRLLRAALLLAAGVSTLIAGCGGGGGGGSLPDPTVRVINLAPTFTADVLFDSDVRERNAAYLATNTSFRSLEADSYDVGVRESGTTATLTSDAYDLQKDGDYLLLVLGLRDYADEPLKRLRANLVRIDRKTPNGTKARVIAVNAYIRAAGSQTPSVQFRGPGDSPQFTFDTIGFGATSVRDLDAGPQTLVVRPDGGEATLVQTTATLEAGKIYLAAFSGVEGGSGDSNPAIRFIEIAPRS